MKSLVNQEVCLYLSLSSLSLSICLSLSSFLSLSPCFLTSMMRFKLDVPPTEEKCAPPPPKGFVAMGGGPPMAPLDPQAFIKSWARRAQLLKLGTDSFVRGPSPQQPYNNIVFEALHKVQNKVCSTNW